MSIPDKKMAAVCGLYCPSCSLYIATREDPARLEALSRKLGHSPEEMICHGCGSDRRGIHCRDCRFLSCTAEKGIDFCEDCPEFPCEELKVFQTRAPHRAELWESFRQRKVLGWEAWSERMEKDYACPGCGTLNSAYDPVCRKCGGIPASGYGSRH